MNPRTPGGTGASTTPDRRRRRRPSAGSISWPARHRGHRLGGAVGEHHTGPSSGAASATGARCGGPRITAAVTVGRCRGTAAPRNPTGDRRSPRSAGRPRPGCRAASPKTAAEIRTARERPVRRFAPSADHQSQSAAIAPSRAAAPSDVPSGRARSVSGRSRRIGHGGSPVGDPWLSPTTLVTRRHLSGRRGPSRLGGESRRQAEKRTGERGPAAPSTDGVGGGAFLELFAFGGVDGAHHQLDLVEDHQRQDDHPPPPDRITAAIGGP